MDVISILMGIGVCALPLVGFLIGRALDPDWLCTQMRRFLKRNYIVLNIVEGDGKTYITRIVNAENDVVFVGNYCWVITKGRVYRKEKHSIGTTLTKKDIRWGNQGAPNAFVTKDDIKPLPLDDANKSNVKPDEIGSGLNAWAANERAKQMYADKNAKLLTWIMLGLIIIALLLAFGSWDNTNKMYELMKTGNVQVAPAGGAGTVQNGSVVINQASKGGVQNGAA